MKSNTCGVLSLKNWSLLLENSSGPYVADSIKYLQGSYPWSLEHFGVISIFLRAIVLQTNSPDGRPIILRFVSIILRFVLIILRFVLIVLLSLF